MKKTAYSNARNMRKKPLERYQAQMELVREKAVLEAEKRYQEQIQNFKAERQAEVDQYQAKYLELLTKKRTKEEASPR